MKRILVITATLGNRDSLYRTIESVKCIGKDDVHHVIVCPQSAIQSVKEKYNNIDCLPELTSKKGIYAALNHGFITYGHDYEYMTFINDDDYWLPAYREVIETAFADPSLDMVYGRTMYVDQFNQKIGSQSSSGQFKQFIGLLKAKNIVLLTQQATLIKSKLFFQLGGFDESYKLVADTKFWMQLSLQDIQFRYLNKECAAYMIQDGQLSSDHCLQAKEHERLMMEFPDATAASWLRVWYYRFCNLSIYMKRIFVSKRFKNPMGWVLKVCKVLLVLLPWRFKRYFLVKCFGYQIDKKSYIGLAYVYPKYLKMDEGASIGHFTVAVNLDRMVLGKNVHIGRSNWITGFPTMTDSKHFAHDYERRSELVIGDESAITKNHHIDCTNYIHIGDYVTIAGYNSQFLTHSIDIYESRQDSHPIEIGDYCFVSTGVRVLGGAVLPSFSVLGAGAVLNKAYNKERMLYAGVPAVPKKVIPQDAKYFFRKEGFVY